MPQNPTEQPGGWCAVVDTGRDEFQGFFIPTSEDAKRNADRVLEAAIEFELTSADLKTLGTLQSLLAEGAVTGKPHVVAAAAYQLMELTSMPYFYVNARLGRGPGGEEGWHTEMFRIDATSPETARDAFKALPAIQALHARRRAAGKE
jgi:hypothetical protein